MSKVELWEQKQKKKMTKLPQKTFRKSRKLKLRFWVKIAHFEDEISATEK